MFDMGKILKEQRILRKMTQEQVARALDVTAASVVRFRQKGTGLTQRQMNILNAVIVAFTK